MRTGWALLAVLAFAAEVTMLVGLGVVGWSLVPSVPLSVLLALALPAAVAVVWGAWCAPRAGHRLPRLQRWAVKTTLFSGTFVLLMGTSDSPTWGLVGLGMWLAFVVSLPADAAH